MTTFKPLPHLTLLQQSIQQQLHIYIHATIATTCCKCLGLYTEYCAYKITAVKFNTYVHYVQTVGLARRKLKSCCSAGRSREHTQHIFIWNVASLKSFVYNAKLNSRITRSSVSSFMVNLRTNSTVTVQTFTEVKQCKMPHLVMLENFLDLDPDTDDFQNLMGASLSKDISLAKFSWRSNQTTDRQTDKCWVKHNLLSEGNEYLNSSQSDPCDLCQIM